MSFRKSYKCWIWMLLVPLASIQAHALPEPLQQAVENIARIQTLRATLEVKVTVQNVVGGGQEKKESNKFCAFQRPNRLRMDYLSPEPIWTEIFNEETRFIKESNGLTRTEKYTQDPRMGRLSPSPSLLFNLDYWWNALVFEAVGSRGLIRTFIGRLTQSGSGIGPPQFKLVVDTQKNLLVEMEQLAPNGRPNEIWRFEDARIIKGVAFPARITHVMNGTVNVVTTVINFKHLRVNDDLPSNLFLIQ